MNNTIRTKRIEIMIHIFFSIISAMNFQRDVKLIFYFIIKELKNIRSFLQEVNPSTSRKIINKSNKIQAPLSMDIVGEGPYMFEWTKLNGIVLLFSVLAGKDTR